jgi:TetR/AcrR family transcriptional regulator, ethionamide resistance regulator
MVSPSVQQASLGRYCRGGSKSITYAATVAINNPRTPSEGPSKRRRRKPEEARREILEAAAALLAERPAADVTIQAIMARTTLSRKSFYVYFRDRADLFAHLLMPLRAEADAALARWRSAVDSVDAGREALRSAATLYQQHGPLLRAFAQAAAHDPEVARVWQGAIGQIVTVAKALIEETNRTGQHPPLEVEPTARALVTMNVHYLLDQLAGNPDADPDATVRTLATIWERTIYLRAPDPGD